MVSFAAQSQAVCKLHRRSCIFFPHLVLSQLLLALGCGSLLALVLQVQLEGTDVGFMQPGLPEDAQQELQWCVLTTHSAAILDTLHAFPLESACGA